MLALLLFAITLLIAVLISERAHRTVLSTAVLFLVAGFVVGRGVLGYIELNPSDRVVIDFVELALFAILFTDGMQVRFRDLVSDWKLPARALLLGLPLTLVGTAVLAHFLAPLPWTEAFLVGAILSPTDPVFASAFIGRQEVPRHLRRLLNVESGLNDGLTLPIIVGLLAVLGGRGGQSLGTLIVEILLAIAIGIAVPWGAIRLEQSRYFGAHGRYAPLSAFAVGLLVLAIASLTGANLFIAGFVAGITVANISPATCEAFYQFGEVIAELLKLAALLVFGAVIRPQLFENMGWRGYLFAALALALARPLAIAAAFLGSRLTRLETLAAGWFGPRGFASVVFTLLVLQSQIPRQQEVTRLAGLVVIASIIAHSSTDVIVARWFVHKPARRRAA